MAEEICFESFFERSSEMLCIAGHDGYFKKLNKNWSEVLGWSIDELCARPFIEFVHPEDVHATIEAAGQLSEGRALPVFVNRYRTKSGGYRFLEWGGSVSVDSATIFASVRDITEERRAAARAAAVERVSGVGSWRLRKGADGPEWSDQVYHIHEVPIGEMPDLDRALEFYPPHWRAIVTEKVTALIERGIPFDFEAPFVTAKGNHRTVRSTGALDPGSDGDLCGTFQDITTMKHDERRLAEIIRGTNAGTWEWNVQTGECRFNERWAQIIGYSLEELGDTTIETWTSFAHPDDLKISAEKLDAHFAGKTDAYECEARMKHRDGRWIWVLDLGRVSTWTADGKPEWISGTHLDITDRKAQEVALHEAREQAEAANEAKSRFLATMSHEIRTPMNGVLGIAEVLSRQITDPGHLAKLDLIRESGQALVAILNDILDFSKVEAGKIELEVASFSPTDVLSRVANVYDLKAREKGIGFKVHLGTGAMARRLGDQGRIAQILNNLVSNAIKFTEHGAVGVTCETDGDDLVYRVSDTGLGMEPEALANIFEAFTQADETITRRFGGTGLGMSITQRLVQLMGGTINIDSAPGRGTTVVVRLPLEAEECTGAFSAPIENRISDPVRYVGHALVVDDDLVNIEVMGELLSMCGVSTRLVTCGADAISAFTQENFDLVILDIRMPEMSGDVVLDSIRSIEMALGRQHVPAIACTGDVIPEKVNAYLAQGFDACLAKPVDATELEALVKQLLEEPDAVSAA